MSISNNSSQHAPSPNEIATKQNYRKSVTEKDKFFAPTESNLRTKGHLDKLSRQGVWQKRFFVLNNQYLNYYLNPNDWKKNLPPKGSVNLRNLISNPQSSDRFGSFSLQFSQVSRYQLKASSLEEATEWIDAILKRMDSSMPSVSNSKHQTLLNGTVDVTDVSQLGSKSSQGKASSQGTTEDQITSLADRMPMLSSSPGEISGYLETESLSRFSRWQMRFYRFYAGAFYCYKHSRKLRSNFVYQVVVDEDCRVLSSGARQRDFQLETVYRVYKFRAKNPEDKNIWVKALRHVIKKAEMIASDGFETSGDIFSVTSKATVVAKVQKRLKNKLRENSEWMKQWKSKTTEQNLDDLESRLDKYFKHSRLCLENMTSAICEIVLELQEKSSECLHIHDDTSVLQTYLDVYCARVQLEFHYYLRPDYFSTMTSNDILRLLDIVVAFDDFVSALKKDKQGNKLVVLAHKGLIQKVNVLTQRYVETLQKTLHSWSNKIISQTLKKFLETKDLAASDIRVPTSAADVLNMISDTMDLSNKAGMLSIRASALLCCLKFLLEYVFCLVMKAVNTPELKDDMGYLCRVLNECALFSEGILDIKKKEEELQAYCNIKYGNVLLKIDDAVNEVVGLCADMVIADVQILIDALFTKLHLSPRSSEKCDNVIERVIATLEDYLIDFSHLLRTEFFLKVLNKLMESIVVGYGRRILSFKKDALGALKETKRYFSIDFGASSKETVDDDIVLAKVDVLRMGDDLHRLQNFFIEQKTKAGLSEAFCHKFVEKKFENLGYLYKFLSSPFDLLASIFLEACEGQKPTLCDILSIILEKCVEIRCDVNRMKCFELYSSCRLIAEEVGTINTKSRKDAVEDRSQFEAILQPFVTSESFGGNTEPKSPLKDRNRNSEETLFKMSDKVTVKKKPQETGGLLTFDTALQGITRTLPAPSWRAKSHADLTEKENMIKFAEAKETFVQAFATYETIKELKKNSTGDADEVVYFRNRAISKFERVVLLANQLEERCLEGQAILGLALVYKTLGEVEVAGIFFQVSARIFAEEGMEHHFKNCVNEVIQIYDEIKAPLCAQEFLDNQCNTSSYSKEVKGILLDLQRVGRVRSRLYGFRERHSRESGCAIS